jgi:hypothetical protein
VTFPARIALGDFPRAELGVAYGTGGRLPGFDWERHSRKYIDFTRRLVVVFVGPR